MIIEYFTPVADAPRAAANQIVSRLVDLGILQEIAGQKRNRLFRYEPYIRIFSD